LAAIGFMGMVVSVAPGCGHPGVAHERDDGGGAVADAASPEDPPKVASVWISTRDGAKVLRQAPDVPIEYAGAPAASRVIDVDPGATFQEIDGFGASLTESSAWLVATKMSAAQRRVLLRRLFDRQVGIGLGALRQPMGASDFALANYSYDDTAPDLADFSIDRDREAVLPVLKEILALAPRLVLFATPWSPPGWMKTSGQMVGGTLLPARRELYAAYFVKFVEAYAAEGVRVDFVTPQNEPHFTPAGYPGMHMEWDEQATFIKEFLGPALAAAGLAATTRILVWDHNWKDAYYATNVLADAAARAYVAGSAFHCYEGEVSAQTVVHDAHPELGLWMTECSAGGWNGEYDGRLAHGIELVIGATRNWARAVITWNLALDAQHGPRNGGCDSCTGTVRIDAASGKVTLEAEYAATGHASHFVVRGAHRVASEGGGAGGGGGGGGGGGLAHVAFVNPDGGVVVIVHNGSDASATFAVRGVAPGAPGAFFEATLAAGAIATYVVGGVAPTLDPSGVVAKVSTTSASAGAALDGDPSTSWTSGAPQTGQEWLALDLGAPRRISAITLDAGDAEDDFARAYAVEVSKDGLTWGASIASGVGADALTTIRFQAPIATRYLRVRETATSPRPWSLAELSLHP
jgi:glucosylceramidase